jgi:hypothetical protein
MKSLLSLFGKKSLERFVRSPQWADAFVAAVVLCLLAYLINGLVSEVNAGNWWGLTYGMLATALMLGAALYGIRRRKLNTDIGKSQTWVQFHVYGGTVFMLLVFMHSGFHLPSGVMNWLLWILSLWVTVSGIVGVALQKWIPKLLTSGLAIEAIYERIPELVAQIRERAEKLAGTCADPVRDFYQRNVAVVMAGPNPRAIYYIDITGGIRSRMKQFEYLRQFVSGDEREKVDELRSLYKTKLELDAHYTLQKALRWWLYTHVPISLVLIVLVALHVYAVWYY